MVDSIFDTIIKILYNIGTSKARLLAIMYQCTFIACSIFGMIQRKRYCCMSNYFSTFDVSFILKEKILTLQGAS